MRKAANFSQLPSEPNVVWGVCETHLTAVGIRKFKTELKFANNNLNLHHGAHAPHRSQAITAIGGTHVGTGFVTNLPSRKLPMQCPIETWNQARCTLSTFLCNGIWIHGAVMYGYAHKAYSVEVRAATDKLLETATTQIVQNLRGPRFIMGDFNQEDGLLTQPQIWERLGWREAQSLQQERFGDEIVATCKQSTTKDYLWMSPELVQFFRRAEVVNHVYPDHGALLAHFWFFGHDTFVHLWRQPKPIPWEECKGKIAEGQSSFHDLTSPEEKCIAIAQTFEERVHANLVLQDKPGLLPMHKGRSQTMETRKINYHTKPLKPGRQGDTMPEFQGLCLQHQRWFTQHRRLESLARLYKAMPWNQKQFIHATREWRAVLKAPGFGGFGKWWSKLQHKLANAPQIITDQLPTESDLCAISLTVLAEVRWFERSLQADLIAKAKHNRAMNLNKVFKDFAKPAVSPVSVLQDSICAQVVDVDPSDSSITLDNSCDFWPGELVSSVGPFTPIIACEDKLWLESVQGFAVGQTVRQEKFIGQLDEMFLRFQSEWQQRWDRHLHTPEEQWEPISAFFRLAQPPGAKQPYAKITRDQWYKALRKKKSNAAQGPDGWTRKDLLALPGDLTDAILDLLHQIENGTSQWPRQWLVGIIHSLEKHEQPATVSGYRPITIFSLIYRNWASIRSKDILRHLMPVVSSYSFGNVPNRCTTNMWMCLQQEIDDNHYSGTSTSGAVLDIVKCFNHLPRVPLFEVMKHLGVATPVLRAWSSALRGMERRFSIRGSVSGPVKSTTGFAEGCSLSVCAMVAANQLIAMWMAKKAPMTRLISFVDNLELFTKDPLELMRSVNTLENILELLDLQVDKNKTYLWSTEGSFRIFFLQNGFNVKTAARDVGAHIQYNRVATNFTITQKIDAFKPRWKSLAISPAQYEQKLRAVKAVAWPNTMHGIASAHVGDPWYEDLRTGALRALNEHRPGCSPPIHLSLVEHPSADPGYYALWTTVRNCRQYMTPDFCIPQFMRLASQTHRKKPEVGPCSVLLHRLSKVFWSWDASGWFIDPWGNKIDLWESPIQLLAARLADAWRYRIACEASSRHTFVGLSNCDAGFTTESLPTVARDKAILRSALNGTFFTADHLKHRDTPGDTRCRMCLEPDSLYHRYWECKCLDSCRDALTSQQKQAILSMAPATHLQGWFPVPDKLFEFRAYLDALPDFHDGFLSHSWLSPPSQELVHYFTDGSCLRPADRLARLCGWGVVSTDPDDSWSFQPIASGCLTGRHQTVVRAELVAATAAVFDANRKGQKFCLWIDNERVVKLMHAMWANPERRWSNKTANHDVINTLACEFRESGSLCLGVFKVASHQKVDAYTPPTERWCFAGNEAADRLAAQAFQSQPQLLACWTELCEQLDAMRALRNGFHKMLIRIGVECLTNSHKHIKPKQPLIKQPRLMLPMQNWNFPSELPIESTQYIIPETGALVNWINSLHNPELPVQLWSWWQLFLDAWLHIPQFGPWYHAQSKKWKGGTSQPPESFQRKSRWFSQYVTKLGKSCKVVLPLAHHMPHGTAIAFWTKTLPVQVDSKRTATLDEWFGRHFPCATKTADLRKIHCE